METEIQEEKAESKMETDNRKSISDIQKITDDKKSRSDIQEIPKEEKSKDVVEAETKDIEDKKDISVDEIEKEDKSENEKVVIEEQESLVESKKPEIVGNVTESPDEITEDMESGASEAAEKGREKEPEEVTDEKTNTTGKESNEKLKSVEGMGTDDAEVSKTATDEQVCSVGQMEVQSENEISEETCADDIKNVTNRENEHENSEVISGNLDTYLTDKDTDSQNFTEQDEKTESAVEKNDADIAGEKEEKTHVESMEVDDNEGETTPKNKADAEALVAESEISDIQKQSENLETNIFEGEKEENLEDSSSETGKTEDAVQDSVTEEVKEKADDTLESVDEKGESAEEQTESAETESESRNPADNDSSTQNVDDTKEDCEADVEMVETEQELAKGNGPSDPTTNGNKQAETIQVEGKTDQLEESAENTQVLVWFSSEKIM